EQVAQLADGAVAVVGQRLDDDGRAAGAVALVRDLFVVDAFFLARAAPDGPLDVLVGHVHGLGVGDHGAQAGVARRVTAAGARGDRQFLDDAREDPAALGVERTLLV